MPTQIGTPTTFRPYIVLHSAAKMPTKVKAPYRNIAILKTDGVCTPAQIRACLGATIHYHGGPFHARGKNTAFIRALDRTVAECAKLNDAHEVETMRALGVPTWRIAEVETARV